MNNSAIDELLETRDVNVDRLLEEDSFVSECKSSNPKLIAL